MSRTYEARVTVMWPGDSHGPPERRTFTYHLYAPSMRIARERVVHAYPRALEFRLSAIDGPAIHVRPAEPELLEGRDYVDVPLSTFGVKFDDDGETASEPGDDYRTTRGEDDA